MFFSTFDIQTEASVSRIPSLNEVAGVTHPSKIININIYEKIKGCVINILEI